MFWQNSKHESPHVLDKYEASDSFSFNTQIKPYSIWEYFDNKGYEALISSKDEMKFSKKGVAPVIYKDKLLKRDNLSTARAMSVLLAFLQISKENGVKYVNSLKAERVLVFVQALSCSQLGKLAFTDNMRAWTYGFNIQDISEMHILSVNDTDVDFFIKKVEERLEFQEYKESYVSNELYKIIEKVEKYFRNVDKFDVIALSQEMVIWNKYWKNTSEYIPNDEFLSQNYSLNDFEEIE